MAKKVQQLAVNGNHEKSGGLHPVVAAISQIEFQGNLVPHAWWHSEKLRFSNGQPNFTAMLILADICYWYRATEKRDTSGKVIELRPKFHADMLQKSYQEWADQFGLIRRQIKDAAAFLVERGLVRRELRNFESRGLKLCNVTFFEPVVDAIEVIMFEGDTLTRPNVGGGTPGRRGAHVPTGDLTRRDVGGHTSQRVTSHVPTGDKYIDYSETTTENTQRVGSVCVAGAPPAGADTHTLSPAPSAKKKSSKKPVEEFPRLTEEQFVVYNVLTTYFPSLGTPSNRTEFARFLREAGFSPYGAALMCGWLESNERTFPFMKLTLFRQLVEEFSAQDGDDLDMARAYCHGEFGGEKLKTMKALWSEWEAKLERVGSEKGSAKEEGSCKMKRGKRGRRDKGRKRTYELKVDGGKIVTVDGRECIKRSDLEQVAWGAAREMGLQGDEAVAQAGMILFDMFDEVARAGLCVYDDREDKIIEVGARTDKDGMPQEIKWVEHPRAVEWPTEIDPGKGGAK